MARFTKRDTQKAVESVEKGVQEPIEEQKEFDFGRVVSTGSTLADLAISGFRTRYGGIPGGVLAEFFGVSGGGKTAFLSEILGSALSQEGKIRILDPEGRLDKEYAKIYGVRYSEEIYDRPDTVVQTFTLAREFLENNFREDLTKPINVVGTDSLAALSTELEMDKGDKIGMKRAKDFSQECRLTARVLANSNNLIVCTNQVRQGEHGLITPGGMSIEFYTSLRVHVKRIPSLDVVREIKLTKKGGDQDAPKKGKKEKKEQKTTISRTVGIRSEIQIVKSSIDCPYRTAPVFIMFNYGIDDVRGNLQWLKEATLDTMYETPDGKRFQGIDGAIANVEDNNLEIELKEQVVDLWHSLENQVRTSRKPKKR